MIFSIVSFLNLPQEDENGLYKRAKLPLSKPLEALPIERLRSSREGWVASATEIHRAFILAKGAASNSADSWSEESLRHIEASYVLFTLLVMLCYLVLKSSQCPGSSVS